jgi:hypothetical protein
VHALLAPILDDNLILFSPQNLPALDNKIQLSIPGISLNEFGFLRNLSNARWQSGISIGAPSTNPSKLSLNVHHLEYSGDGGRIFESSEAISTNTPAKITTHQPKC